MLIDAIESYIALRQTLGFKLDNLARNLIRFGRFATDQGDTHIRVATAAAWAADGSSPLVRHHRLRDVTRLARFLASEDPAHEVPRPEILRYTYLRRLPYIYSPDEVTRLIASTRRLSRTYPLRRETYATLFGLIAATGLRLSEALDLRVDDVRDDGVLHIRRTKFGKSRMVPLHPSAAAVLERYLLLRRARPVLDDHLFLSLEAVRISVSTAEYAFGRLLKVAGVGQDRQRKPRIHDLRHTFATRALERCPADRKAIAEHFVALSTYLGHVNISSTYWYLEATPELMSDVAAAAEQWIAGGVR